MRGLGEKSVMGRKRQKTGREEEEVENSSRSSDSSRHATIERGSEDETGTQQSTWSLKRQMRTMATRKIIKDNDTNSVTVIDSDTDSSSTESNQIIPQTRINKI